MDEASFNALAIAAAAGGRAHELYQLLADNSSSSNAIDCSDSLGRDEAGLTALHSAVFAGSLDCARILLSARAQVDIGEANGATPLQIAAARCLRHCAVACAGTSDLG